MKSAMVSIVSLVLLATGCGGSSSIMTTTGNLMTGKWTITGTSQKFQGAQGTGTGSLVQSGTVITGTFNFSGGCASAAAVTGSLTGADVSLILDENGQNVSLVGTVNSNFTLATGTFTSPAGGCTDGDFGTWKATKN